MSNSSSNEKLHFVLVPLMAQGHTIPMVDMAHLLTTHGATITFVTTPLNASRLSFIIDKIKNANLPIKFISFKFPCLEVGLPVGCENIDVVPCSDLLINFMRGCALLREPLLCYLKQQENTPNCIISDAGHIWTDKVARELGIPRIVFNGYGCFALLCRHIFHYEKISDGVKDEKEVFVMPGMPHRVEMTKSRAPSNFGGLGMDEFRKEMMDMEVAADGAVVNSFEDLEAPYVQYLQKARNMKIWTIGPMSLYNQHISDMAFRGNKASVEESQCLRWLDTMSKISVLYVSFGSLASTPLSQLIEIGLGLEASNCPFVWVIKAGNHSIEVDKWLAQGYSKRVSNRGFIIRVWAPQLAILSHPALGGFMTHCGWNSVLESISSGVPMITWPHFAEQFLNEKLIVEVHKFGIAIGVDEPIRWGVEHEKALVMKDQVEKTVRRLMYDSEGREMRKRVDVFQKKAKQAMEKYGSSHENLKILVGKIRDGTMKKSW